MTAFFPKHVARIVEEMGVLSGAEQDMLGNLCKKVGLGGRAARMSKTRNQPLRACCYSNIRSRRSLCGRN